MNHDSGDTQVSIPADFVYKSRVAAATLAIFTGTFGGHRFYLGQWWGIFYLLFFWSGIPTLIGLVEAIVFLANSQHSWNEKYNRGLPLGNEKVAVVVIFACVIPVMAIVVFSILAAVALPAYQDYSSRVQVAPALGIARQMQVGVEDYYYQHQAWPADYADLGDYPLPQSKYIGEIKILDGTIYVTPAPSMGIDGQIIN
ncbi:MAG: NINE protein, partial [Cellvibrionaceae bacterium]|nr:NINE protein [Cellvibrionaceae bacterium]